MPALPGFPVVACPLSPPDQDQALLPVASLQVTYDIGGLPSPVAFLSQSYMGVPFECHSRPGTPGDQGYPGGVCLQARPQLFGDIQQWPGTPGGQGYPDTSTLPASRPLICQPWPGTPGDQGYPDTSMPPASRPLICQPSPGAPEEGTPRCPDPPLSLPPPVACPLLSVPAQEPAQASLVDELASELARWSAPEAPPVAQLPQQWSPPRPSDAPGPLRPRRQHPRPEPTPQAAKYYRAAEPSPDRGGGPGAIDMETDAESSPPPYVEYAECAEGDGDPCPEGGSQVHGACEGGV